MREVAVAWYKGKQYLVIAGAMFRRFPTWLEAHSRWNQLRVLGDSGLVKASVLMPAFGYILLLNENVHQYLTIKYDGWLLNYLSSLWRIWLLFYGSFCLATGSLLFSWRCPREIKQYTSEFEIVDAEREHRAHQNQINQVRDEFKSFYLGRSKWETSIFSIQNFEPDSTGLGIPGSDPLGGMLFYRWTLMNVRRPMTRIVIAMLFGIGLALLAVPAAFTFLQVTLLLVHRLI
jgi:hypothetical protein